MKIAHKNITVGIELLKSKNDPVLPKYAAVGKYTLSHTIEPVRIY